MLHAGKPLVRAASRVWTFPCSSSIYFGELCLLSWKLLNFTWPEIKHRLYWCICIKCTSTELCSIKCNVNILSIIIKCLNAGKGPSSMPACQDSVLPSTTPADNVWLWHPTRSSKWWLPAIAYWWPRQLGNKGSRVDQFRAAVLNS